ncbi:hypothetical protein H5410_064070 [Solanum commersonii]|uniref:Uncharacterized protein n=1 Tax=Solanum commersonii TaxID=4109 RepID=A0A9J5W099_SOLCO|nr:hypothetical protein H5410_064070 [Solanum commersonii]
MEPVCPHGQNDPFSGLNNPRSSHGFFGDPKFRPCICKNFSWTFIKTLPMERVGPHDQNGPFSRSNDPQSRTLPMELVGLQGQNDPFLRSNDPQCKPPFCRFLCAIVYEIFELVGPKRPVVKVKRSPEQLALTSKTTRFLGQTIPEAVLGFFGDPEFRPHFAKILPGRPLRPYLWNQLALTAKTDHFQGQTIPGASKPLFC